MVCLGSKMMQCTGCTTFSIFIWMLYKYRTYHWAQLLQLICLPILISILYVYDMASIMLQARNSSFFTVLSILFVMESAFILSLLMPAMVEDKESGMREYIRIASPHNYLIDFSRFVANLFISLFMIVILFVILENRLEFAKHISVGCMIILILLFALSGVALMFMISSVFTSAGVASLGGAVLLICACFVQYIFVPLANVSCMSMMIRGMMIIGQLKEKGKLIVFVN